ncbi:MAG: lipoprotein [Bacilli bacterium]|nr:lipoprotein [Bacilli bacterium]
MKKTIILLLTLVLLSGCNIYRMDNKNYEEVADKILSLNINLYNKIGKGYKYYAPKRVVKTYSNSYNDVLEKDGRIYYLYVDVVSYYYKTKLGKISSKNAYFYKNLKYKNKVGYLKINKKNNKLYVQMLYNYAKIETYVDKKELNDAIEDISYILSSVKFNDTLLKKMYESGELNSKEQAYKLFKNKNKEGNFLEYIKEYDKYDDTSAQSDEELNQITTTKKVETTTTKSETTKEKEETTTHSE